MKFKDNKAITLIALVITIVVLIILAAVAINLTLGDNGIFQRAKQAKEKQIVAEYKEKAELVKTEVALENGNVVDLDKLKAAFDSNEQKSWVNSTEIIDDGGVEKLKLITNDGYIFYITPDSVEYQSKVGADTTVITITASPENNPTTELSSITVAINVSCSNNITGSTAKYAWKKGSGSVDSSAYKTLTLDDGEDAKQKVASITSGQDEDGDYYLWIKVNVNGKEKEVSFGEYKFKAKPTPENIVCRIKSKSQDNTTGTAELGSDMVFDGWSLSYTKNGGTAVPLTQGTNTDVENVKKGDVIVVTYTKSGQTPVQATLDVSELKIAYTLYYDAKNGTTPTHETKYDITTFTVIANPSYEGKVFEAWYPNEEYTGNTTYSAGSTFTITSGTEATLYAKWGNLTAEMIQYNATWGGQTITNVKQALDYLYTQFNNN